MLVRRSLQHIFDIFDGRVLNELDTCCGTTRQIRIQNAFAAGEKGCHSNGDHENRADCCDSSLAEEINQVVSHDPRHFQSGNPAFAFRNSKQHA